MGVLGGRWVVLLVVCGVGGGGTCMYNDQAANFDEAKLNIANLSYARLEGVCSVLKLTRVT